ASEATNDATGDFWRVVRSGPLWPLAAGRELPRAGRPGRGVVRAGRRSSPQTPDTTRAGQGPRRDASPGDCRALGAPRFDRRDRPGGRELYGRHVADLARRAPQRRTLAVDGGRHAGRSAEVARTGGDSPTGNSALRTPSWRATAGV